jgi:hypothetical protein
VGPLWIHHTGKELEGQSPATSSPSLVHTPFLAILAVLFVCIAMYSLCVLLVYTFGSDIKVRVWKTLVSIGPKTFLSMSESSSNIKNNRHGVISIAVFDLSVLCVLWCAAADLDHTADVQLHACE